jgi:glutamate--cysteine ligase
MELSNFVPHLTTAQRGALQHLESHLLAQQIQIEHWFRQQWAISPAPFYASVDLRNAGFKLAPVDTNLFPAGFNNLNPAFLPLCIQSIQSAIEKLNMEAARILLIPENHTRNQYYLQSIATLSDILQKAGYEVRIGGLEINSPYTIDLATGISLLLEPILRHNDIISVQDFKPCLVLLNNDLSSGIPPILQNIRQQIIPPLQLGWAHRLKSAHFAYYKQVANEFAQQIAIDSWLIDPIFKNCGEINFMKKEGEACLANNVGILLDEIQAKYDEYGVKYSPFVVVKADAGSYGMGVMTVHSAEEMLALNRKQRVKMSATKGGQQVSKVIIQEGVYSFETWDNALDGSVAVAEPVVYMMDHFVVGGFYRVHKNKGINENLNAPGMHFEPLAFVEPCNTPDKNQEPDANPNRFYAYGVIARLALLAAAREIQASPSK